MTLPSEKEVADLVAISEKEYHHRLGIAATFLFLSDLCFKISFPI